MKSHVDTKHATAAKLRSKDSVGQQFLASIVLSAKLRRKLGAPCLKMILNEGVEHLVHAQLRRCQYVCGKKTGGTLIKDGKGNKGFGGDLSNSSESDSGFDSDDESEEEEDEVEDDMEDEDKEWEGKKRTREKRRCGGRGGEGGEEEEEKAGGEGAGTGGGNSDRTTS